MKNGFDINRARTSFEGQDRIEQSADGSYFIISWPKSECQFSDHACENAVTLGGPRDFIYCVFHRPGSAHFTCAAADGRDEHNYGEVVSENVIENIWVLHGKDFDYNTTAFRNCQYTLTRI